MKEKKKKLDYISIKRFRRKIKSKLKKRKRNLAKSKNQIQYKIISKKIDIELNGDYSLPNLIENWMSSKIKKIIYNEKSQFSAVNLAKEAKSSKGKFLVPKYFSIVDYPDESYKFIRQVFGALLFQTYEEVLMDYSNCKRVDIGAQVLLDIFQLEIISFYKKCNRHLKTRTRVKEIGGINIRDSKVYKILFSVGSPAIHNGDKRKFPDIIPYHLCVYENVKEFNSTEASEKKDIDTTSLVDYVLSCLSRIGKTLTSERIDDLCIVISEILINAEEHSSDKTRYSIGYFEETNTEGNHFGIFKLAILNFGDNIYSKFKDPNCPNKSIVAKMKTLSSSYTKKGFWRKNKFEEETLWTLYSLQEGVTSVPKYRYKKRGNGSIRFIESFFNIKVSNDVDDISKMAILSGNTSIIFDGKYGIKNKVNSNNEKFQVMTFNQSGNIEEQPDENYVKHIKDDFPGTIISARILFNKDDFNK